MNPGDRCPCKGCRGLMHCYSTHVGETLRTRYYKCRSCGYKPNANKQHVPLSFAPKRRRA